MEEEGEGCVFLRDSRGPAMREPGRGRGRSIDCVCVCVYVCCVVLYSGSMYNSGAILSSWIDNGYDR